MAKKAAPETRKHYFTRPLVTEGAVTKQTHKVGFGSVVEAPDGEFAHVGEGFYQTRPLTAPGNSLRVPRVDAGFFEQGKERSKPNKAK